MKPLFTTCVIVLFVGVSCKKNEMSPISQLKSDKYFQELLSTMSKLAAIPGEQIHTNPEAYLARQKMLNSIENVTIRNNARMQTMDTVKNKDGQSAKYLIVKCIWLRAKIDHDYVGTKRLTREQVSNLIKSEIASQDAQKQTEIEKKHHISHQKALEIQARFQPTIDKFNERSKKLFQK